MADYKLFIPGVLEDEGFISNDAADKGGLTIWGLTKVADKDWEGWKIVDGYIKKNPAYPHGLSAEKEQLKQLAIPYYKTKYWDKVRGDEIKSQLVAKELADEAINAGIGAAIKTAQTVTGFNSNGEMSNDLINNLNNMA